MSPLQKLLSVVCKIYCLKHHLIPIGSRLWIGSSAIKKVLAQGPYDVVEAHYDVVIFSSTRNNNLRRLENL